MKNTNTDVKIKQAFRISENMFCDNSLQTEYATLTKNIRGAEGAGVKEAIVTAKVALQSLERGIVKRAVISETVQGALRSHVFYIGRKMDVLAEQLDIDRIIFDKLAAYHRLSGEDKAWYEDESIVQQYEEIQNRKEFTTLLELSQFRSWTISLMNRVGVGKLLTKTFTEKKVEVPLTRDVIRKKVSFEVRNKNGVNIPVLVRRQAAKGTIVEKFGDCYYTNSISTRNLSKYERELVDDATAIQNSYGVPPIIIRIGRESFKDTNDYQIVLKRQKELSYKLTTLTAEYTSPKPARALTASAQQV